MARLFLQTLYGYRRQSKFRLHAFVLMPEHFHLLITSTEITLERAIQLIKGGYSHAVKHQLGKGLEIWERGLPITGSATFRISNGIANTFTRTP